MDSESIIKSTGDKLAAFTLITFDPRVISNTHNLITSVSRAVSHTRGRIRCLE